MSREFSIPLRVDETHGIRRVAEAIRIGVPLPRGLVTDAAQMSVITVENRVVPSQARALALWSDGSIKWVLVETLVDIEPNGTAFLQVRRGSPSSIGADSQQPQLRVDRTASHVHIDTEVASFQIPIAGEQLLSAVTLSDNALLSTRGVTCTLLDKHDERCSAEIKEVVLQEVGRLMATVQVSGTFRCARRTLPVRFTARMTFCAGSAHLSINFKLWNPQPALHPGGLWDLGDPGSFCFKDLSLECHPAAAVHSLDWYAEDLSQQRRTHSASWSLYQDSSGGERWNSPNHLDANARPTVTFRGYCVSDQAVSPPAELLRGDRATPGITASGASHWVALTVRDFWQSFPKALRWHGGALQAGLFPAESVAGFELQGGEQKCHTVYLEFGLSAHVSRLAQMQHPLHVAVDPAWIERSKAVTWFVAASPDEDTTYSAYVRQIVDGPHSFENKRELIDEFGWRNFGDLYADHEAVHHTGSEPFISHYNNQYDFIYGACLQYMRSSDARWRRLMMDAARHSIDIDIYRTHGDRAAFNGGLFWHTDHYKPAVTCTHRTYSEANAGGGDYGGGPADEHNYSSGFLYYYYLTGDPEGAQTVLTLADWVCAMDDGSQTLFCLIDDGPTGFASASRDSAYHGPGRGAGNSINTLMDAYAVSGERRYWQKAEELLQRCIHPADDISKRNLDDPENRWSYLVFLQVLGKYLGQKLEMGEIDYSFWYARDSLLHYARWVREHEVPYKDVLHKVELPTETWSAHDVRKCHVLHLAGVYATNDDATAFHERADFFFHRCLSDLLSFPTAHLTRPLVILCVYGTVQAYFSRYRKPVPLPVRHTYRFGTPVEFLPQRFRLGASLRAKLQLLRSEVGRLVRQKVHAFRNNRR